MSSNRLVLIRIVAGAQGTVALARPLQQEQVQRFKDADGLWSWLMAGAAAAAAPLPPPDPGRPDEEAWP
jgi:hypothetical protein